MAVWGPAPAVDKSSPAPPRATAKPTERQRDKDHEFTAPRAIPVADAPTDGSVRIATLNCMWFFAADGSEDGELRDSDRPRTREMYERKSGHLIGMLPRDPPLFIGLQEVGGKISVETLTQSATKRYGRAYQGLFVQGKDTYTGQDVAALFDTTQGWKLVGQPARHADLERTLAKHLVVTLEKNGVRLHICVVHLRVPKNGDNRQADQVEALLRWTAHHNSRGDNNVVIMGDMNEGGRANSDDQNLQPLLRNGMHDSVFDITNRHIPTHGGHRALDRILISGALRNGSDGLALTDAGVIPHAYTRRNNSVDWMEYSDHFAVWAIFAPKSNSRP
ncbi:hypothetical protein DB346_22390 [Verrucomicrobia bacterium LW23]|nr:hypothetical protein DB346_22390 [Verrucomicrobia bacterium LW23]